MQLEYQISISADLAALDLIVARINQIQATEEKSAGLAEKSLRLAQAITSQRQTENDLLAKSHYLMQAGRTAEAIQAANLAEQVRQQRMLNEERQRQAAIRPAAPKEESFGSIIATCLLNTASVLPLQHPPRPAPWVLHWRGQARRIGRGS